MISRIAFIPIVAVFAGVLSIAVQPAWAGGGRHGHHGAGWASGGHHHGSRFSAHYGVGFGRRSARRHRRGSRVYFSFHAPLYASPPAYHQHAPAARETVIIRDTRAPQAARALPNMPSLNYTPRRGQNHSTLTRDRRICERSAWRQTRPDPRSAGYRTVRSERVVKEYRDAPTGNILYPAASGAALGALGGAIAGDVGAGAAIGAIVGAASWVLGGGGAPRRVSQHTDVIVTEYVPAAGPDPRALRSALTQCMRERGYRVS